MDSHSITAIVWMAVLVLLSAFFSASETAFSSLNRIRIKTLADDGSKRAMLVLQLSEKYDSVLSAILVGNNIVNIAVTSIATVFFLGILPKNGASVSTVVMTVVILIFGEVTPKCLAKAHSERFAMAVAPVIRIFVILLTPIDWLFRGIRFLLSKAFRLKEEPAYTEDDLLTIVEEAEQDGGIDGTESELIRSAIEFNDHEAIDIFTPRVRITAVEKDASLEEIAGIFSESGFSRLPVYNETIDDIIGILHEKDFYESVRLGGKSVAELMKPPVFVTRKSKLGELLGLFRKTKSHMAVISDEYGGTVGIVTLEDVLEELVGEIYDEHDEEEPVAEFQQIGENEWRVLCSANLDDLLELLDTDRDEETDATSVGGWVLEQFPQVPPEGETFTYQNLFVTVTKVDQRCVTEIAVEKRDEEEEEEKDEE